MKVIIIDDEQPALDELKYYLSKRKDMEAIDAFTESVPAIEKAKKMNYDAAFLDIDMPVINGLNVARELMESNSNIKIVFITAYNDYAVKAFELNALDYLLKPIDKNRLEAAVEKLIKSFGAATSDNGKNLKEQLSRIDQFLRQENLKIAAYDNEETIFVKMCDVLFLEAESGKTFIKTASRNYKIKDTLDSLEIKLSDYGFFRCHRSYIINLRHISKLSPMFNNYMVKLEGSTENIPVSRNVLQALKSIMNVK